MGNVKSKKSQKEMDKFFERERHKEIKREEKKRIKANPLNKRIGMVEGPVKPVGLTAPATASVVTATPALRSYDDEALDLMRYQLHYDSDAFLLNNILLSIQFFNNYESELNHIKNNPIGDREHAINDDMVQHHKHVFFADRLQECVFEHVRYERSREKIEPLVAPKLFIIYDNVEASEPGDTSDYSTVLDAPFYKLCIKDTKEPGFVNLQKLEILKSMNMKEPEVIAHDNDDDSIYTDSEKESVVSDDISESTKGHELLEKIKKRLDDTNSKDTFVKEYDVFVNKDTELLGRRASGPIKQMSYQVQKSNISHLNDFRNTNSTLLENKSMNKEQNVNFEEQKEVFNEYDKPRKSILKNYTRRLSGPVKEMKNTNFLVDVISEDTETSGYRSNTGSRQTELSESESDYGYSTITQSTTPKKIELSMKSTSFNSGVLPEECWTSLDVRFDFDDDNEDEDELPPNTVQTQNLYETQYYLNSLEFMRNFVDIFITNVGTSLGLTQESIRNALTQGASIYCNALKNGRAFGCEIYPAIVAAWPNSANQFIIRERKIIQNPRTNFSYQWPTKQMVHKTIELGCFLIPVGFRPKRGLNQDQKLQWKVIFPAAERYLEKCLAHSHVRCYLFALTLHKTFMENETSKVGIDASHFKNHLFWQCEDNFAKWPEDRLGESLRTFLQTFYVRFGQSRFPNYFMNSCNEFKSIPKPLLLKLQRKVADVIEAPVAHILYALSKLKYNKRDFYPKFNINKLYEILTCKNPLRIVNPSLPLPAPNYDDSSDSESENSFNFWDKAKMFDKNYRWKKEKQRRLEAKRKAMSSNKQKAATSREKELNPNFKLPAKMDVERRRLVLELFIPHFIAMARSSEKFEAIGQAIIYLEQAHRLCLLLIDEPAGDITANEYLEVIRDKLADCQRKLAKQGGYKLPPRAESNSERPMRKVVRKNRPRFDSTASNSPSDIPGISPFTFADVHVEEQKKNGTVTFSEIHNEVEESKL
ncbi:uncharacterized protein LOC128683825 [Plodia interpunctella]|uniref:uncharacterized protein LOC128683825 n=1 Tax=Plodia interpunctella TaxID=58824 RepID=UPI002368517D|nr:uncharacterized protein LOC128683825 [Plodia interpunctella]